MATPEAPGPCEWPIDTSCCPGWDDFTPEVQARATALATQVLDGLTGRQFAQCPIDYRPCGPRCEGGGGYMTWPVGRGTVGGGMPWMIPYVDAGIWRNCVCPGACSCGVRCEVPFPSSVAAVTEVTVDGLTINPTAYRLDSWRGIPRLVRTDGECWPLCQDMNVAPDAEGAFVITYQPGRPLPLAGQIAAGDLACEFAKACAGGDCALPQQMASLTRNGVQLEVVDPAQLLTEGLTGIQSVDLWVQSVNPARRAQRSRVASVDTYRGRFQ
ncbi:hypothetical protein [Streptomyces sp. NPDC046332]|uniref:hypothetical protein n=1 Tax=unclassified Streptomyces TaxID=2593676 RepID=UPI0033E128E7